MLSQLSFNVSFFKSLIFTWIFKEVLKVKSLVLTFLHFEYADSIFSVRGCDGSFRPIILKENHDKN